MGVKMKKLFVVLPFLFAFLLVVGFAAAQVTVLDNIDAGDLATWTVYDSVYNPAFSHNEIISPHDGSTAIETSVSGNTIMYCDTKFIYKTFDVGAQSTKNTDLNAYLEFWSDNTYYNFPYVTVYLFDSSDNVKGYHIWYGKDMVGGFYQDRIASDPAHYTQLPSDKGMFDLDLQTMGNDVEFTKVAIYMTDYTCIGNNHIILDSLSMDVQDGGGSQPPVEPPAIPEVGVIAAALAMIGALGIYLWKRQ
jgi:hypothetical protein